MNAYTQDMGQNCKLAVRDLAKMNWHVWYLQKKIYLSLHLSLVGLFASLLVDRQMRHVRNPQYYKDDTRFAISFNALMLYQFLKSKKHDINCPWPSWNMTGDGSQLIMHHAMFIKNVLSIVSFLCPCTSTMDEQDSKVERGCLKINVVDKKKSNFTTTGKSNYMYC